MTKWDDCRNDADVIRRKSDLQSFEVYFVLSPQRWIESTEAIGITSTSGRYGGTYAHRDIAGNRLKRLNQIAIRQMQTLTAAPVRQLPRGVGAEEEI